MRELGGLYVLGTERHESRRIDNQLRGRSGRQGDPGESRFYLSLEDELMRLFATGAMNWVMGKALPDDVPIEAKMVTKAIERAQNTVEQRNAEIRKNVLKYDEVMNEQRKVIYRRRDQILDGADLRDEAIEHLADGRRPRGRHLLRRRLRRGLGPRGPAHEVGTLLAHRAHRRRPRGAPATDELYEQPDGRGHRATTSSARTELGPEVMREVERQVMLRIIDQRWREHLYEMDYLQEGINLRAMGQKDPLDEWQREGFEMFGQMMTAIADDFVTLRHARPGASPSKPPPEPELRNVQYSAPEDPARPGSTRPPPPAARPRPTAARRRRRAAEEATSSRW